jgi:hypothetical protein
VRLNWLIDASALLPVRTFHWYQQQDGHRQWLYRFARMDLLACKASNHLQQLVLEASGPVGLWQIPTYEYTDDK